MTRNERRKAQRERATAKQERLVTRLACMNADKNRKIVRDNLSRPAVREHSIRSCLANLAGQSHRAYVCRVISSGPSESVAGLWNGLN
jgi:hypothetical protein